MTTPAGAARRKDSRAEVARELLADFVIAVIAEVGVSRLTHRRVAAEGRVSLSTTTYHYRTKGDMLADAAQRLLDRYVDRFRAIARDCRQGMRLPFALAELCFGIVRNAADRKRATTQAWCEIMLDAARTPEGHEMAQRWFADLQEAWADISDAVGEDAAPPKLTCMIDLIVGLLFVSRGLQLDQREIAAVEHGDLPGEAWRLDIGPSAGTGPAGQAQGRKSTETRERLLQTAIELLIEGGTGAVGYAAVAQRSGEAMTAPAYHFSSISGLLKAAQTRMFRNSKDRCREVFASGPGECRSAEELADVTAAIFIREATQFRPETIAHYSIWLEATRDLQFRPDISAALSDQLKAWSRRLEAISGGGQHNALVCYAMFVGALIRAVSTGARTETLAGIRAQFLWLYRLAIAHPKNSTLFQNLLHRDIASA